MKKLVLLLVICCFSLIGISQDIIVSGAGTNAVNGTYAQGALVNGKPSYTFSTYRIEWDGSRWRIEDNGCCDQYYISFEDVATPDLATNWMDFMGMFPIPTVSVASPALTYFGLFVENRALNNGSINTNLTITFNGFGGDFFTGTNGSDFITENKLTIANLPSGLVAVATKNSNTELVLTLAGNAVAHTNVNDLSNLTLEFQNTAFNSGNANAVNNYLKADIPIEFIQTHSVGSTGDFTSIASAIAGAENNDILLLAGETFTESGLVVDKNLWFIGQGASQTIVQAHSSYDMATNRIMTINSNLGELFLKDLTFKNGKNTASNSYGGGIFCQSSIKLKACVFEGNIADGNNGGAYCAGGAILSFGSITLENCLFNNNKIRNAGNSDGGAINGSPINILNSTFYNNHIEGSNLFSKNGGAVYGNGNIINSTFTGNSASNSGSGTGQGGAIYSFGGEFVNNIIYGNTAKTSGGDVYRNSGTINAIHNIIGVSAASSGAAINGTNTNNSAANPLLGPLANNGGETQTIAFVANSPARDAGYVTGAPVTDQRGFSRSGSLDIGALEYTPCVDYVASVVISGAGTAAVNGTYVQNGTVNGKPSYTFSTYKIQWNGFEWTIEDNGCCDQYYVSFEDVATPDLVTNWMDFMGMFPLPTVSGSGPALSYSGLFIENRELNDGSINTNVTITFNGFGGDFFTGTNGSNFIADNKLIITNLPSGLTAIATRNSNTELVLTLSGNASSHANIDDLSNMTLEFQNSAFNSGLACEVRSYLKSDLQIEFIEYHNVGSTGDFTSVSSGIAGAENLDVLLLAGETFTESGLVVDKDLWFIGQGASQTIVQAHASYDMATNRIMIINSNLGELFLKDITFKNGKNTASNSYGGGIFCQSSIKLKSCVFEGNIADGNNGGAYCAGGAILSFGSITLENCLFNNNKIRNAGNSDGGAINGSPINILNCTFYNNHIDGSNLFSKNGGAVYGNGNIINSTFTGNSASNSGSGTGQGGAIYSFGGEFVNNIIYGNTAKTSGGDVYRNSGTINAIHNIIGVSAASSGAAINGTNTNNSAIDPNLQALADNGGETQTIAILTGSAAKDAGYSTGAPTTDQRGYFRDGSIDIGAFEFGAVSCTTPTISSSTAAARCGTGTVDIEAEASAGIVNWYAASSGGTSLGSGTTFATPSISETTTYYAEAVDGGCVSANRQAVTATINAIPTISSTIPSSRIGAGSITISATASAGSVKWFATSTGGSAITDDVTFDLSGNDLTIVNLGTTTTYHAEAQAGSCLSISRTPVIATINSAIPNTQIITSQCNLTLNDNSMDIYCDAVAGAVIYEFRLLNGGTTLTIQKPSRTFKPSQVAGCNPGTTYQVSVRTYNGAAWSDFGPSCPITTKSAIAGTKLQISQCGITLSNVTTDLYANAIINATQYRFRITKDASVQEITKTSRTFKMSQLATVHYGSTVSVEVDAFLNGAWIGYGDPCNITMPALSTTKLQNTQCGIVLTTTTTLLYADQVFGATQYRFRVKNATIPFADSIVKASRVFRMSDIPGLAVNTPYQVDVAVNINGTWQAYGAACNVTTPAALAIMIQEDLTAENDYLELNSEKELTDFVDDEIISQIAYNSEMERIELIAYPNPSKGDFTISSSHEGTFNIINELGQLVQTVEITKENNYQMQVGVNSGHALNQQLQPGIYFITGTINNEVITNKIVVQ